MKYAKVGFKQAEKVKNRLFKLGVFSKDYAVLKGKNFVYFPVTKSIPGFDFVEKNVEEKNIKLSFKDLLKDKLSREEFELVTKAYDVVGNIAILEIDKELLKKKKTVAEALLKVNKNVKTVVMKLGEHRGKYRVQEYAFLAGEKKFETLHKENGALVKLNISKVYYSPRLSNERLRVASLVKNGEEVLVMFSGVGVYPLVISKHSKPKAVYGVEINPVACKYAEENVKINKFNNIKLFYGDVRKVVPKLNKKFDRIIMPLPKTSLDFLDLSLKFLKKGGFVHLYTFSTEQNISDVVGFIKKKCKCKVLNVVKCGQQSPKVYRFCIDFRL